jgi:hypothetical protein
MPSITETLIKNATFTIVVFLTGVVLVIWAVVGTVTVSSSAGLTLHSTAARIGVGVLGLGMVLVSAYAEFRQYFQRQKSDLSSAPKIYTYDIFISSVLAGFKDVKKLQTEREGILRIVNTLENEFDYKVYYAGRHITNAKSFGESDITDTGFLRPTGAVQTLPASRYFILIYPEEILSSVLFEAGIASVVCEKCYYFVRKKEHLPFLMQHIPQMSPTVETYTYKNLDDLERVLKSSHAKLFPEATPNKPGH